MSSTKDITVEDIQELLKERLTVNVRVHNVGLEIKVEILIGLDEKLVHRAEASKNLMDPTND